MCILLLTASLANDVITDQIHSASASCVYVPAYAPVIITGEVV